jgi:hypothetical protein
MNAYIYLNRCIKRLINKSITKYTIFKKRAAGVDEFVEKKRWFLFLYIYIDISLIVYIIYNCLSFKELNKRFPEWSRGTITIIRVDFIESP